MKSLNLASQTYKELGHRFIRRLVPFVGFALLEKRWIRHKSLKLCSTRCLVSVSAASPLLLLLFLHLRRVRALPHFCINIFVAPFLWHRFVLHLLLLYRSTDFSFARKLDLFWLKQPKNVFLLPFFLGSLRLHHVMMSCPRFEGHSFNLGPEKTYISRRRLLWRLPLRLRRI